MRAAGTDAVGALRWGLRRYRWLFLACLLLGAVGAPVVDDRLEVPAQAEALVVAQRLDMDLVALPRYGEAVFDNGAVAQAVAARFDDSGDFEDIVPDRVSLVAEQDSIVLRVIGHDVDPQVAADLANTAAEALVPALNATGVGAGTFALQSPAVPPAAAGEGLGTLFAIPVGIAAGLVLGFALIAGLLVLRRPVIAAEDAEEATGVPALGTVAVPRTRRSVFARPDEFSGLVPVCRRLLGLSTPTVVLVSRRREERARRKLAAALAEVLGRVRDVRLVGPAMPEVDGVRTIGHFELAETMAEREAAAGLSFSSSNGLHSQPGRLTLVDSSDPADLLQPPRLTATVLVVREGISSAALRSAVVEHLGGSAEARLLLVRRGRRSRGRSAVPAHAGEAEQREPVASADRG